MCRDQGEVLSGTDAGKGTVGPGQSPCRLLGVLPTGAPAVPTWGPLAPAHWAAPCSCRRPDLLIQAQSWACSGDHAGGTPGPVAGRREQGLSFSSEGVAQQGPASFPPCPRGHLGALHAVLHQVRSRTALRTRWHSGPLLCPAQESLPQRHRRHVTPKALGRGRESSRAGHRASCNVWGSTCWVRARPRMCPGWPLPQGASQTSQAVVSFLWTSMTPESRPWP